MAEIAFRNVTKRFGATLAVDDASFTVADNEFFCFFGPPLSGKSTILRLILGLEKPDSGEILIDGKAVNEVSPAARNIAMVFQNLALFPHMTAADNVRFPLVERREAPARIEARLKDAAEKLHIGHILHKMPGLRQHHRLRATGNSGPQRGHHRLTEHRVLRADGHQALARPAVAPEIARAA